MKTRSDPKMLRALAHVARLRLDIDRDELVKQLEGAAFDIEYLLEDLEMERETMRAMAHQIAVINPPKELGVKLKGIK